MQRRTLAERSTQHHQHRPAVSSTAPESDGSPDLPPPPPETPGPPPAPPSDGTTTTSSSTKTTAPPVTVISHTSPPPHPHTIRASLLSTYPRSLARLGALLPSTPFALDPHHRPSKADLLRLTDSAWERARIRWKWLTIRGFRRFNVDDWGAVFSWVLVGNIGWLVLGTGSFFGMVLLTANTFSLQGASCAQRAPDEVLTAHSYHADIIAKRLSDYFTSGSGITVIFESALVPKLFASTIMLNNVYVSRRPADARVPSLFGDASSPLEGQAGATAADGFKFGPEDHREHSSAASDDGAIEDDGNYTQFDLNIDCIEVELSFVRWLNGEGLIKSAVVSGVRGVLGSFV